MRASAKCCICKYKYMMASVAVVVVVVVAVLAPAVVMWISSVRPDGMADHGPGSALPVQEWDVQKGNNRKWEIMGNKKISQGF